MNLAHFSRICNQLWCWLQIRELWEALCKENSEFIIHSCNVSTILHMRFLGHFCRWFWAYQYHSTKKELRLLLFVRNAVFIYMLQKMSKSGGENRNYHVTRCSCCRSKSLLLNFKMKWHRMFKTIKVVNSLLMLYDSFISKNLSLKTRSSYPFLLYLHQHTGRTVGKWNL